METINDARNMNFVAQQPYIPYIVPDVDTKDPIVVEVDPKFSKVHIRHWYLKFNSGDHRRTKKGAAIPIADMSSFLFSLVRLYNETVPMDQCLGLVEIEVLDEMQNDLGLVAKDEVDWWGDWTPFGEEE